jgi:hypothetical protein
MKRPSRFACLCMFGALGGAVVASAPAFAQYTAGQPAVAKTASSLVTDQNYWDASQFTGSPTNDICGKIHAAWIASMGSTGATIDARGITGPQSCSASPFPSAATGVLLLGSTVISTAVTWQIPSDVHLLGIGNVGPTDTGGANTVIRAASGLTGAVVQLGNGSSQTFDAQVMNLTVDGNAIATIGILNNSAEEGSFVQDVNILNVPGTGLEIARYNSTTSPNNSGPYRNINVQYNSTTCPSCNSVNTIGVAVTSSVAAGGELYGSVRGIDNVTVTGSGTASSPGTFGSCMQLIGYPVQVTNSHVEYCATGIQIGASAVGDAWPETNNVEIQNVSIFPNSPTNWNVTITRAADIMLSGITGFSTDVLDDTVTGNTILGTGSNTYYLGFYLLGDATVPATNTTVISTNAGITTGWVAPGNLKIVGNASKGGGSFKIDHPLDPANKYLYHSFVESPDMMNVYNGSVTTDKHGMAVVTLPDYFDALNKDFRYQLTAIGSFAQATVAKKIENNSFAIRTSKPGVEVSWQVTGIRQDPYANAHRVQVEEQKPPREQGHYLHPELFKNMTRQVATEQPEDK